MTSCRLQLKVVQKKRFKMDPVSSDDENDDISYTRRSHILRKLSSQSFDGKRRFICEFEVETDAEQDLEVQHNPVRKHLHKEKGDFKDNLDHHCPNRIKSFGKRYFWSIYDNEVSPDIKCGTYEEKKQLLSEDASEGLEEYGREFREDAFKQDFYYDPDQYSERRSYVSELYEDEVIKEFDLIKNAKAYFQEFITNENEFTKTTVE